MTNSQTSSIRTDKATTRDELSFDTYRDTILEVIRNAETPLTIGVFGAWGAGKTSLLLMLQEQLSEVKEPLWFNAWQYNQESSLWRVLLGSVLETLRPLKNGDTPSTGEDEKLNQQIDDLQTALYHDVDREELGRFEVDWGQLAKGGLKGAVKLALPYIPGAGILADLQQLAGAKASNWTEDLMTAFQRQKTRVQIAHIQFLEQFREQFQKLVKQYCDRYKARLVVFIDDLDRCLPDKAIDILEAIKVFLDAEGCVFVIAVDPKVIVEGIRVKYRDFLVDGEVEAVIPITGDDYIEKIIQLPFYLPPVTQENMINFIKAEMRDLPESAAEAFALGIEANPRKIKRALNVFWLHKRMADRRPELADLQSTRLAKVVAIQSRYPELYRDWVNAPLLLRDLEMYLLELQNSMSGEGATPPGKLVAKWADSFYLHLHRMLLYEADVPEVCFSNLTQAELEKYLYLTISSAVDPTGLAEASGERLWGELLSGDRTRISSAVGRIHESERTEFSRRLMGILRDSHAEQSERNSAGDALAQLGDPRFDPTTWCLPVEPLLGFYRIPEGEFLMGSDPDRDKQALAVELPQHRLVLPDPYYIAKYLTTADQFKAFVNDSGYQPVDANSLGILGDNHPTSFVTWNDALAYCTWLDGKLRKFENTPEELRQLLESGWSVTLPSEAEWEKAARGVDGRIYPWGDDPLVYDKANLDHYGESFTTAVGCYPNGASPYGLADMSGNVWEWTRTLWGPSHDEPVFKYTYANDGREDLNAPGARVLRGGSYAERAINGRCAYRDGYLPEAASGSMGFRIAIVNLKSIPHLK
ncbi:MAG: SUMF1/EgtB/PvdO family nonheme iron enzyme [Nitrososphaera sp.]|nr:SUMF1/EgtB/PvdO family nonheme iron enzyme [Nitrososphaera sp.]MCI0648280.1 SUMF1/EgtB/PvdO family nonheme iron enzyme [Chloroflexota bacterium]